MKSFQFIVFALISSFITGFKLSSKYSKHSSLKLSPGEINQLPSPITRSSSLQFQKIAVPLAVLASVMLPFFSKEVKAEETSTSSPAESKPVLGPPPADFGLAYKDFYADAVKVVNHMRYATLMDKTTPLLSETAQKVKDEMLDFVSYYRRFTGISGKQTFSLLYTSINVLSGHYTSYGTKFPVPEKRRKRLLQEFNDIEKNIRKKR